MPDFSFCIQTLTLSITRYVGMETYLKDTGLNSNSFVDSQSLDRSIVLTFSLNFLLILVSHCKTPITQANTAPRPNNTT